MTIEPITIVFWCAYFCLFMLSFDCVIRIIHMAIAFTRKARYIQQNSGLKDKYERFPLVKYSRGTRRPSMVRFYFSNPDHFLHEYSHFLLDVALINILGSKLANRILASEQTIIVQAQEIVVLMISNQFRPLSQKVYDINAPSYEYNVPYETICEIRFPLTKRWIAQIFSGVLDDLTHPLYLQSIEEDLKEKSHGDV